jgi:hypothetical protein
VKFGWDEKKSRSSLKCKNNFTDSRLATDETERGPLRGEGAPQFSNPSYQALANNKTPVSWDYFKLQIRTDVSLGLITILQSVYTYYNNTSLSANVKYTRACDLHN